MLQLHPLFIYDVIHKTCILYVEWLVDKILLVRENIFVYVTRLSYKFGGSGYTYRILCVDILLQYFYKLICFIDHRYRIILIKSISLPFV